ncbi:MFS transporter [Desulfoscipio sp. XC116]|uniref:MFS transporter n=1 Tax=Desulfoscipio sp. XC116 TaxID=3144975 RepID=UPI00325A8A66
MANCYILYGKDFFQRSLQDGGHINGFNDDPYFIPAAKLTIAGGQTISLIGSAAVQFSLICWLASETASPIMIHLGLSGMGTSSLLCGLLPAEMIWFWVFAALCALLGASCNLYNIPYIAYMQETIAPDRMGRAFSLIGSLSSATMPLGLLIAGPIAENRGVPLWFFVSGSVLLLLTLVSALLILPKKADKAGKSEHKTEIIGK